MQIDQDTVKKCGLIGLGLLSLLWYCVVCLSALHARYDSNEVTIDRIPRWSWPGLVLIGLSAAAFLIIASYSVLIFLVSVSIPLLGR